MNEETLERIVMDRALGALAPDTNALLEAFLEKEPGYADRVKEIEQSIALAKRALPPPRTVSLPPLKIQPLRTTIARPNAWQRVRWPIGLAAAFVLGFSLSSFTVAPDRASPSGADIARRALPVTRMASTPANIAPSDFWSASRLAGLESKTASPRPPRLTWISPVRKPQLNY